MRFNVMNTARIRAAIIQGSEFVAGRTSQRWAHMIEL